MQIFITQHLTKPYEKAAIGFLIKTNICQF